MIVRSALLLSLAGCAASGAPTALLGPAPGVVLVLPVDDAGGSGELSAALLATIGRPLRERGYYVVPIEVGQAMLVQAGHAVDGAVPDDALPDIGRAVGAEACLQIRVERWEAVWVPTLQSLDYAIGYRLRSTHNGATLWEHRAEGAWSWSGGPAFIDADRAYDAFLTGPPDGGEPFSPFEDAVDVARVLQRGVIARLPPGPLGS
jgi:hypothetical protein